MNQEKYKNHGKLLSGIIYPEFFTIQPDEDVLNVAWAIDLEELKRRMEVLEKKIGIKS